MTKTNKTESLKKRIATIGAKAKLKLSAPVKLLFELPDL